MENEDHNYLKIICLHLIVGFLIYLYKPLSVLYIHGALFYFILKVILNNNKNNEALQAASYIAGAEVFVRMTDGLIFYETGKYAVILFLVIGMFYKGASNKTVIYWFYLLILIPGIIVASIGFDYNLVFRKEIAFNLSGPVSLGITALYCYYKKISASQFDKILVMLLLPIVAQAIYLLFYTPNLGEIMMTSNSNFAASGGFGPNQIATVMGLAAFILLTRLVDENKKYKILDLLLLMLVTYRGLVTFSRGGMVTALICAAVYLYFKFNKINRISQSRMLLRITLFTISLIITWLIISFKTNGLINYRYSDRDAAGKIKNEITTGRIELIETELTGFYNNPVLGIGVGRGKDFRGYGVASHNEISRMLSEHGLLGLTAILILIFVPIIFWFKFKNNYYFLAFVIFWFLTINHSAMRIALPGFVYGLALLYIVDEKKNPIHRKRLSY